MTLDPAHDTALTFLLQAAENERRARNSHDYHEIAARSASIDAERRIRALAEAIKSGLPTCCNGEDDSACCPSGLEPTP